MKYQVVRSCVIGGQSHNSGAVVEVGVDDARVLMGMGRITPHAEPVIENRSVELDKSPEKTVKRKKDAS